MTAPIAVALDAPDPQTLTRWAAAVAGVVSTVKIGLEVYLRDGAPAVWAVRETVGPDCGVFLDLKLHDIPATVGGAARSVQGLRPDFLTVHAAGGPEMIKRRSAGPARHAHYRGHRAHLPGSIRS